MKEKQPRKPWLRSIPPWLLPAILLLACSSLANAQLHLHTGLIEEGYRKDYASGRRSVNGVIYHYYRIGNADEGDFYWTLWNITNRTLTPEKPYIEFAFGDYDSGEGRNNDQSYYNQIFIKYKGENYYHDISTTYTGINDVFNINQSHGYAIIQQGMHTISEYNMHISQWRFYPREINPLKPIERIRLVTMQDDNMNGGECWVLLDDQKKTLNRMMVYEWDVKYDLSALDQLDKLTESANGKVNLSISNNTLESIASDNSRNESFRGRHSLKDVNVNWSYHHTSSVRAYGLVEGKEQCVGSYLDPYKDGEGTALSSIGIDNVRYDARQYYRAQQVMYRKFETTTNAYVNPEPLTIEQSLYLERESDRLSPMAHPKDLTIIPSMWDKKVHLSWTPVKDSGYNTAGKWYVFRNEKGKGAATRTLIAELPLATTQYKDEVPDYDKVYMYAVSFVPNAWEKPDAPIYSLTDSTVTIVPRNFPIKLSLKALEENGVSDGLQLTWAHAPVQINDVKFNIYRRIRPTDAQGNAITDSVQLAKIPYTRIATVERVNAKAESHTYTDKEPSSPCDIYEYKVTTSFLGADFESNTDNIRISGGSQVKAVNATKGTYDNMVKISWEAQQVGTDPTKFIILRKQLGADGEYFKVYTTQGTATEYSYDDLTAFPGNYYEYKVEAYSACEDGTVKFSNAMSSDGFCQSTGTISGRITYGTGTAVEGVKVVLKQSTEEAMTKNQFYALLVEEAGGGVSSSRLDKLFSKGKPFSLQLWTYLSLSNKQTTGGKDSYFKPAIAASEAFLLYGEYDTAKNKYALKLRVGNTVQPTTLSIDGNQYNHLTLSYDGKGKWSLRTMDSNKQMVKWEKSVAAVNAAQTLKVGSALNTNDLTPYTFKGFIDEIRVWNRVLTDKEIQSNYDRLLAGSESGLKVYWPMDEGIKDQTTAYDFSKTDGVGNECHGLIGRNTSVTSQTPSAEQFSLYGMTDGQGNYVIRGIPFSGEGNNYIVTPTMGIHEFSPQYVTRYVNANSLNHSGADMQDVSSFPVSGAIYYAGTNYPVEGVNFYIDGTIASRDGEPITTDAEGKFEISVPIGNHHIEVRKNGHVFKNDGRYPADPQNVGKKENFAKEITELTFYDETLVTIAGRITGGEVEEAKPLGFGESKNNIGQAVITLSTGYQMNVTKNDMGQFVPVTTDTWMDSPTADVNSTAVRKGGRGDTAADDVRYITITTDPETGEFAAKVPPVSYKVESIKVPSNGSIQFDNIPLIEPTDPQVTQTDSLMLADGTQRTFDYHASLIKSYRVTPSFTVTDTGNEDGAFGEKTFTFMNASGKEEDIELYTVGADSKVNYTFGQPIFVQFNPYRFKLKAFEEYVNKDESGKPVKDIVPLDGAVVTITNPMSSSQQIIVEGPNSGEYLDGLKSNQLKLDSIGEAVYKWTGGFPNLLADQGYAHGLNITYENNGQTLDWSGSSTFKGIVIGNIPTGSNFVTTGPDKVLMVLRDPPGSNSYASYKTGHTTVNVETTGGSFISNNEIKKVTHIGVEVTIINGLGVAIVSDMDVDDDFTLGLNINAVVNHRNSKTITATTTRNIQTSSDPGYVGADGDVFIGSSTNLIFGNARAVNFIKNSAGQFSIGLEDVVTMGTKFSTAFNYSQKYIETVLIPNFAKMRNSKLRTVTANEYKSLKNTTGAPIFITTLDAGDSNFGIDNYKMLPPKKDSESCIDTIAWYNSQIKLWENILADNEKQKVKAKDNRDEWLEENVSLDNGAVIEATSSRSEGSSSKREENTEIINVISNELGVSFNGVGIAYSFANETGGAVYKNKEDGSSDDTTTSYVIADSGINDALSVDVFKAPDGHGPIFVTRGGQTSCPYEGEVLTKYYMPGTSISAATMQVEKPQISVTNTTAANVPTGGAASYEVKLSNLSETDNDIWFDLALIDASNPKGAKLSMDGAVLTDGRTVLVPAGKTLTKSLLLEQTDLSILEYEDIQLVLRSQCQGTVIADTVSITATFVPSCSNISLSVDKRTLNAHSGDTLTLTVSDINRSYSSFKGFRIEYKYANDYEWTTVREYVKNPADVKGSKVLMPNTSPISYQLNMSNKGTFPDGAYTFRAITICQIGNDEIHNESEEITVIKDKERPQPLGAPNPSSGILRAGDDIFVTFNEDIRAGAINADANILVTGVLNGARVAHNTALQLNGSTTAAAATQAGINLGRQSFASDVWVKANGAGTILEHGTAANKFAVGFDEAMHLVTTINGKTYTSENTVPASIWLFLSFSYDYQEGNSHFSAQAAYDDTTIPLMEWQSVADYHGNGRLTIGKGLTGAIHELTLWNCARTLKNSQAEMHLTKYASTPNLIGYWKMDEGAGTTVKDVARNRHMVGTGNWALNNVNKAAAFNGTGSYAMLDISTVSVLHTDNYAIELWFKGDAQKNATLFAVNEETLALRSDSKGKLALIADGTEIRLSETDYLDGQWHHFALNVLRNGSASAYMDGTLLKQIASSAVPALAGDGIVLGATRYIKKQNPSYSYRDFFKGEIDEVRFWNAKLTGTVIGERSHTRMDAPNTPGLVAYYPFESRQLGDGNQMVTVFDTTDQCVKDKETETLTKMVDVTEAVSAPGLKEAPALSNLQFSFTASERQVYIKLHDAPERLEGTTVNITLRDMYDLNNNIMQPIVWTAYIDRNCLGWSETAVNLSKNAEEDKTFSIRIDNLGGDTEQWAITNLPAWLSANETQGSLRPLSSKELTFTVNASTPIGNHEATVYVHGNDNIHEPLTISLKVKGEAPEWNVNAADWESSMSIIGQLQVDGIYSENPDDILAAFMGDRCVGIASPIYMERYDAYFVMLDVYGNGEDNGKPITFKMWDASTGDVYLSVTPTQEITFAGNSIFGSMGSPIGWNARVQREQKINLIKGWNWVSIFVEPEDNTVAALFAPVKDEIGQLKNAAIFAQPDGKNWSGLLESIVSGKLYKVKADKAVTLSLHGGAVNPASAPVAIGKGWNWIGFCSNTRMALKDAFAGLHPAEDDIVKGQNGFAIYQGYEWVGSLTTLIPGQGYMYHSNDSRTKSFTYPTATGITVNTQDASLTETVRNAWEPEHFVYDAGKYSQSMILTGETKKKGVEAAAFIDGECRGAVKDVNGVICLTVFGEHTDNGKQITFKVYVDGEEINVNRTEKFAVDDNIDNLKLKF